MGNWTYNLEFREGVQAGGFDKGVVSLYMDLKAINETKRRAPSAGVWPKVQGLSPGTSDVKESERRGAACGKTE